jgi:hypothetical protein
MSNTSNFFSVDSAALRADFDPEDFFFSAGMTWCGDTFETGYVFREQLDTVIGPLLSEHLRAVVNGDQQTVADPAVDLMRTNDIQVEIVAFTQAEFAEFQTAIRQAVATADWGYHDNDEWVTLGEAEPRGEFVVLAEFV